MPENIANNSSHPLPTGTRAAMMDLRKAALLFRRSSLWRASWQILTSVGAYGLLWLAMYFSLGVSWWLTVPLAVLAGGLLVRIFIIFHDCGHGSFFKSKRANNFWGVVCGVLTFTPYFRWRWQHARHHASSGNLDHRGVGDIWTLTVEEYTNASRWKRFRYRVVRNPALMFLVGPLIQILVIERLPSDQGGARERHSVWWVNLSTLLMAIAGAAIFGVVNYLIIQLTIVLVAGAAGIWLFYVQHQFDGTYWARKADWDYERAAIEGSSYYKLPRVLQWFSGNIGFHHIHHFNPSIPNYNLERCHHSSPVFAEVPPLTLVSSLKSLSYRLWDEPGQRLISFYQLRKAQAADSR